MKLLFLCGSLEQGRDGVGDYTRRLAIELIRKGHNAVAVSLNEKNLDVELEEEQTSGDIQLHVYRLPAIVSGKNKWDLARNWINNFDPDWISLQYVPYSFHPKGLPFNLDSQLEKLGSERRWHIMFHELWVGISKISPLKHRLIGFLQRKIARDIVKKTKPLVVTTSNQLYKLVLASGKIEASILPLFSNISVAPANADFVDKILNMLTISRQTVQHWRLLGIFGNLYPEANLENALAEQLRYANDQSKKLALISIGRINNEGLSEFKRLEATFSDNIRFLQLGEQPEENVSNIFQILNVGISCTPAQHIGKSGVFAAMKLHGLGVILPSEEIIPEYELEIRRDREEMINKSADTWSVSFVSQQFINLIKTVKPQ